MECAARVRQQYPDATGATWGVVGGINGLNTNQYDCFAEIEGTGVENTKNWLSCTFKGI